MREARGWSVRPAAGIEGIRTVTQDLKEKMK